MSYDYAGWLEDHATDASRTGAVALDEESDHFDGDLRSTPPAVAGIDPLDALLKATWNLLRRPPLHSHTCHVCHFLRPCLQQPCHFRALDCESSWVCGECVAGEEPR